MKDMLNNVRLKGHVLVELKDAKTGCVVQREEGDNFIALPAKEYAVWQQLRNIVPYQYAFTGSGAAIVVPQPFKYLFLNNDTSVEDPETERMIKPPLIGFANTKTPWAGQSTIRGTVNAIECAIEYDKARFVFDFGTNCANGVFQSIGFGATPDNTEPADTDFAPIQGCSYERQYSAFDTEIGDIFIAGSYLYQCSYPKFRRMPYPLEYPLAWENISTSFTPQGTTGCCYYNGKIYTVNSNPVTNIISIRDTQGIVENTITVDLPTLGAGIAPNEDGTFWVGSDSASTDGSTGKSYREYFYKINSSGAVIDKMPKDFSKIKGYSGTPISGGVMAKYKGMLVFGTAISATSNPLIFYDVSTKEIVYQIAHSLDQTSIRGLTVEGGSIILISLKGTQHILHIVTPAGLSSRVLLANPVLKQNTQTLKVTYDLLYDPIL